MAAQETRYLIGELSFNFNFKAEIALLTADPATHPPATQNSSKNRTFEAEIETVIDIA